MDSPFESADAFGEAWVNAAAGARGGISRENLLMHAPDGSCIRALLEELPVLLPAGGSSEVAWTDLAQVFGCLLVVGRGLRGFYAQRAT